MALRSTGRVEQMVLTLHSDIDHTICFQFRGQHSIIKTCTFYYSESDVFNVNFDKDATTHQISARTSMLSDLLSHIRGTDEMTLEVDTEKKIVKLSSFHPSLEDNSSSVYVHVFSLSLSPTSHNILCENTQVQNTQNGTVSELC